MRKDPPNCQENRGDWTVWFGLLVFALIFLSIVINFDGTRSWLCAEVPENKSCTKAVLSEFQTLITGIAAVIGVFITVKAMRDAENSSKKRHRQLIGLSLRADALEIDRLFKSTYFRLSNSLSELRQFSAATAPPIGTIEQVRVFARFIKDAEQHNNAISDILNGAALNEARRLYDGEMTETLNEVQLNIAPVVNFLHALRIECTALSLAMTDADALTEYGPQDLNATLAYAGRVAKISTTQKLIGKKMDERKFALDPFFERSEAFLAQLSSIHSRYKDFIG